MKHTSVDSELVLKRRRWSEHWSAIEPKYEVRGKRMFLIWSKEWSNSYGRGERQSQLQSRFFSLSPPKLILSINETNYIHFRRLEGGEGEELALTTGKHCNSPKLPRHHILNTHFGHGGVFTFTFNVCLLRQRCFIYWFFCFVHFSFQLSLSYVRCSRDVLYNSPPPSHLFHFQCVCCSGDGGFMSEPEIVSRWANLKFLHFSFFYFLRIFL